VWSTRWPSFSDHTGELRTSVHLLSRIKWRLSVSRPQRRAIAQAVSRRLPTAAARLRSHVRSCGICRGQSGTWAGFLRVVRFSLPIMIPPNVPYSPIIWGWYNRQTSGRCTEWTQSHPTQRYKKKASHPLPEDKQEVPLQEQNSYFLLKWHSSKPGYRRGKRLFPQFSFNGVLQVPLFPICQAQISLPWKKKKKLTLILKRPRLSHLSYSSTFTPRNNSVPLERAILFQYIISHLWWKTAVPTFPHWPGLGSFLYPFILDPIITFFATLLYNRAYSWSYVLQSWRWRKHCPPKCRYLPKRLQVSQSRRPQC
jgi:hypothetical protein